MPCTCPIDVWPARPDAESRRVVYSPQASYAGAKSLRIPCGQCLSCRLARSQDWAVRCVHEAQMHEVSSFITATYSDEHLPSDLSVSKREHELFGKRMRNAFGAFRFFGAGEYGSHTQRPHYHYLLFGLEFPDRQLWKTTGAGMPLYRSELLEKVWQRGECLIGDVTFESAAYVARYCTKKVNSEERAAEVYARRLVDGNGDVVREWQVEPEFMLMSRRPGIGSTWFDRFAGDCFPSDFLVVEGRKVAVPGYYLSKLAEREQLPIKLKRKASGRRHAEDNTERRLMTKHESARLRGERLVRELEAQS